MLRRWTIWRIDRGEDQEVWSGVEGPATNPPDDRDLAGSDWVNVAKVEVVEAPNKDRIEAVADALTAVVALDDDDGRPAPREHYIDLARQVAVALVDPSGEQGEEKQPDEDWPSAIDLFRFGKLTLLPTLAGRSNGETRRYVPATDPSKEEQRGIELIAAERKRQLGEEGWTPEHDDQHRKHELVLAAQCYMQPGRFIDTPGLAAPKDWPWETHWWKPSGSSGGPEALGVQTDGDRIRNLTKAGALITAEIDRLLRASSKEVGGDGE